MTNFVRASSLWLAVVVVLLLGQHSSLAQVVRFARNLDQAALRETFREFIGQVASAGPNAVGVIYLAGFGLQFEGENYFAIRAIRER
jgi:hypothetical protein